SSDLVDVTRLANQCGIVTRLGDEAERAALHGLYVEGAQPGTFSGISDQGPAASASSASTTPADDVEAIMRARVEGGASPSPTSTEAPATPDVQPPAESEQSHTETED